MDFYKEYLVCSRSRIISLFIVLCILFAIPDVIRAQDENFTPSRELSLKLFEEGEYAEALKHFESLLELYPADPLYKFYSGASLVETASDPGRSVELLETALESSSSLRRVPNNAWYYLGRAYQLNGSFDQAIRSYDRFRELVRKKELKDYDIDKLIEQCQVGAGSIIAGSENNVSEEFVVVEDTSVSEIELDTILDSGDEKIPDTILTPVNEVRATPHDYDVIVGQALEYQFIADSLSRLANRYRLTVNSLSGTDRETVSKKIIDLENQTFEYQSLADNKLAEAASFNRNLYDDEPIDLNKDPKLETIETVSLPDKPDVESPKLDSINVVYENEVHIPKADPILKLFFSDLDQPASIPVNDTMPEGLFYRIQTAAFRNPVKPSYFKTLGPVFGLRAKGSDITFYNIGMFRKKEDADRAVTEVRAFGFKDAFVIAQFEGKRISFERSDILEKEWGDLSLIDPGLIKTAVKQSEPVTLVFRVQVRNSKDELSDEELETLRLVSGTREFSIIINDEDEYVYLIGKFLTFESALSYSDLLFRNGMKEARVAAYMGEREIPVDKARELFEKNYNR